MKNNTKWLDRNEYPFQSNFMEIDGHRIHYVDEGRGETVLFVHGTPAWSFLYRHLIKGLSKKFRCVAIDHLGFGLSDKPKNTDLTPSAHAWRLENFIGKLGLKNIHLVVQDFGGPIGLSYAINHPDNIKSITVSNSWCWSLKGMKHFERARKLFGGWLGKFLYLQYGFSTKIMLPQSFGNRKKLTKKIHWHYRNPLGYRRARLGTYIFLKSLIGASDWFDSLWQNRNKISGKPSLILWGMKDLFLPAGLLLEKWETVFDNKKIIKLEKAGHFIEEEEPQIMTQNIFSFISSLSPIQLLKDTPVY